MTSEALEKIIQQIEDTLPDTDKQLVAALRNEIARAGTPENKQDIITSHHPDIDANSGCYRFDADPNLYCPHCFDHAQKRVATQRINRQLRVCTQCRASLKPVKK